MYHAEPKSTTSGPPEHDSKASVLVKASATTRWGMWLAPNFLASLQEAEIGELP